MCLKIKVKTDAVKNVWLFSVKKKKAFDRKTTMFTQQNI